MCRRAKDTEIPAQSEDATSRETSCDALALGLVSLETAEGLLQTYRTQLCQSFPFVAVPSGSVGDLNRTRPALCLAILAVAFFDDQVVQNTLTQLFNKLVGMRMMEGLFPSLDLLQGLLIQLAWYVALAN